MKKHTKKHAKIQLAAIAILALFAPLSFAALTVQDFSCNGGQTNVELGSAFSCTATLQNDDPNNDATLNTVTLSALNGWTSQSSYAGTFSGNSVTRGGTKTVAFQNIVPTSPKASNKFTDITINGAPSNAAKVSETAINVLSINSLSATAPSSAASASEFEAQASIILGGSATLNATITLSGGCAVSSGQSATKTFGTIADTTIATSWKITQSTSTCTSTITATASAFPILLTSAKSASTTSTTTTSYPTSFGSTGASSGSYPSTPSTPTATPAPTAIPTPAAQTKQLGENSQVTANIGETDSSFELSYAAPAEGFEGTISYKLPLNYADYLDGKISFDPKPSRVRQGSVVAEWAVSLLPQETFQATVTVAKKLDASVLQEFAAPTLREKPTPAPVQDAVEATPTPAPQAQAQTAPSQGGIDWPFVLGVLLAIAIAAGAIAYWHDKKAAQ